VSSSGTDTLAAQAFVPNRETLDAAIAFHADHPRSGGAVDAERRVAALARFLELPAPGLRPGRNWKYDYDKLRFDDLHWTSDRRTVATLPFADHAARDRDGEIDRPALATENAGGLVHLGATLLEAADVLPLSRSKGQHDGAGDARVVILPLADAWRSHGALLAGVHGSIVDWRADKFAALAMDFQNCGAFGYVPAGVRRAGMASCQRISPIARPQIAQSLSTYQPARMLRISVSSGRASTCERHS